MYVCGVTVYDLCHLGDARCYIAFDLIHRWRQVGPHCLKRCEWRVPRLPRRLRESSRSWLGGRGWCLQYLRVKHPSQEQVSIRQPVDSKWIDSNPNVGQGYTKTGRSRTTNLPKTELLVLKGQ